MFKKVGFIMQEDKRVSVIIANYNNQIYLQECLDSVLAQTYGNIEIVVVDDCSTDDSLSVLRKYEEMHPNIKVFVNETNSGVSRTRINAIENATGEYITVLDPDDYYISNTKIEKEMELILKYKKEQDKDIIAFSNYNAVGIKGVFMHSFAEELQVQTGDISELFFIRKSFLPMFYMMSKKQFLSVGGYEEQIPIYEDHDLAIRLTAKYEFYYTGNDGLAHRYTRQGLSSANISHHNKWLIYIYKKNFHLLKKKRLLVGTILYLDYIKAKLRFLKRFAEKIFHMK